MYNSVVFSPQEEAPNHMDEIFEDYLLTNDYDRFEGYLLSIVRDAYRAGFLAGLTAKSGDRRGFSASELPEAPAEDKAALLSPTVRLY